KSNVANVRASWQDFRDGSHGDFSSFLDGIAVCACRDCRECQRCQRVILGETDGLAIAAGERAGLVALAAVVNRPYGVDDVLCEKATACRDDSLAGGESVNLGHDASALFEDGRSTGAMDRAIDASSTQQGRVGGIDDGVR